MLQLNEIEKTCWQALVDGSRQPAHPFRNCTIAHAASEGTAVYTIVLRHANEAAKELAFYADIRSEKIEQLKADPHISVLFYDKEEQWQIVVAGQARIDHQNEAALHAWQSSGYKGRTSYLAGPPPSTPAEQPADGLEHLKGKQFEPEDLTGYENFAVITIKANLLEHLQLNREQGNRRARFKLIGQEWHGTWIIP